jgi:hypothetical protein
MDRFHPYIKPERERLPAHRLTADNVRRPTPKCPPWASVSATKVTNADGSTVEGYLTLFPSAGQYEAMWSGVPETLNVRGDETVAGVMVSPPSAVQCTITDQVQAWANTSASSPA